MIIVAVLAVVGVAAVAFLLRDAEEIPIAEPTPEETPEAPEPTPTPTPTQIPPIVGEREVETVVAAANPIIFHRGDARHDAPETDNAAVEGFADRIADWLDRHLTHLQTDGGGLLREVTFPGMLARATPEQQEGLTTHLIDADRPAEEVSYRILVMAAGAPEWAQVRVRVRPAEGDARAADLTFVTTDEGPQLIAGRQADPDSPPAEALPHPSEDVWDR